MRRAYLYIIQRGVYLDAVGREAAAVALEGAVPALANQSRTRTWGTSIVGSNSKSVVEALGSGPAIARGAPCVAGW